ncbi:MAG TPA: hypothetical protein VN081_02140 [Dongiaceae bacterium]|nr:hypothetical protein [Dongiaceae bacterium]
MITNLNEKARIETLIANVPAKRRFVSDYTKARYLAKGESIVGIVGSFANSIITKPFANSRSAQAGVKLYYGASGVLVHEELFCA